MVVNVNNHGAPQDVETSVRQSGDQTVLDVTIRRSTQKSFNEGSMDRMQRGNYGLRPTPMR